MQTTKKLESSIIFSAIYEHSWQETALQLVATKLKAALLVDGDLAEGLGAMEVDVGNLMDALMKAVAQERSGKVEWGGMEIAAVTVTKPLRTLRPSKAREETPQPKITKVQVKGGGEQ
jgi:hypothetical protein